MIEVMGISLGDQQNFLAESGPTCEVTRKAMSVILGQNCDSMEN
jgi:hypothetical protein